MKKIPAPKSLRKLNSFTLIELLVVIGIIAILAAAIMFAGTAVLNAAKRAKANNLAHNMLTAGMGYYTEYSVYPVGNATTDAGAALTDLSASGTKWGYLIDALCGNISPRTGTASSAAAQTAITNSRGIAFLSLKASEVDTNDAPLNALPTGTQIYFNIAFDADYDGVLGVTGVSMPNFATGTATTLTLTGGTSTAGIAIWANCNGKTTLNNSFYWVHTY